MSKTRSRCVVRGAVTMLLCGACLATYAPGQLQERDALTPVIGGLPLSTSVVVVSSRPSAVLDSLRGPWKRLGPIAAGLGSEPLQSWAALARQLDYQPGEAFSELTSGGLAMVIASNDGAVAAKAGPDGVAVDFDARWAVLSVVKSGVAARVREKLKAAPHEVIAGLPVLSIEEGRFALVCRGLTDAEGGDEVLALSPMEDRAFLESIVAAVESARPRVGVVVDAKAQTLAATRAFARAKKTPADVLILANEPEEAVGNGVKQMWRRGTVIACGLTDRAWTFDAVDAHAEGVAESVERLPPEASALFDAWSASAGVMVASAGLEEIGRSVVSTIPGGADSPEARFLSGAQAGCIYMGPSAANVKSGTVGGGMSVWAAVRVKDRASLPVSVMDAVGGGVATNVEGDWSGMMSGRGPVKQEVEGAVDAGAFASLPEFALRVVSVKLAPGGPFGGSGDSPVPASVAWFQCGASGSVEARWAAMGIEPRGDADAVSARHRGMVGVLSGMNGDQALARTWVMRGVIRPEALIGSLPMPMGLALGFSGITSVKEVRFESWDEKEGAEPSVRTRVVVEWK